MIAMAKAGRVGLNRGEIFTTGAIARMLACSPKTVNEWVDHGVLRGYRLPGGQGRRVRRHDLMAFFLARGVPLPPVLGGVITCHVLLCGPCPGVREELEKPAGAVGFRCLQGETVWDVARLASAGPGEFAVIDCALGAGAARDIIAGLGNAPGWRDAPQLVLLGEDNGRYFGDSCRFLSHPWAAADAAAAVRAACGA